VVRADISADPGVPRLLDRREDQARHGRRAPRVWQAYRRHNRCEPAGTRLVAVFEKLEGFPADWKTNGPAFIKFVREHPCPSFLECGEYPYVSAAEIKKAPALNE